MPHWSSVKAMAQPLTYDCNDDKQMQVFGQMATAEQLYAECLYVCMCNREAFDPQTNIPVHVPNSNTHAINIIRTIIFQRPSEIRQLCLGVALRLGVSESGGRG